MNKAPECVIVCQQSVDCGAWPNGACEQGCAQAERAAKAETHPVEVWHGDRKVTVYPLENVLRIHGRGPQDPITDEPFSLKAVQDAMDWLYEAPAAQAGDELPPTMTAVQVRKLSEANGEIFGADWPEAFWQHAAQLVNAALAARGAQAGDAQAKLARFGALVLQEHRSADHGVCDVDGGTLQEHAITAGVIYPRTMREPCGESCECAAVTDFPTVCYFTEPDVLAVLKERQG